MGIGSHFAGMRALVAMLADAGMEVCVFTDRKLETEIPRLGGRFVDLLAGRSLESNYDGRPHGSKYVEFAARYADEIASEVAAIRPSLVLSDTFAVIGPVVANVLGVPHVNVCAGHNMNPETHLERFRGRPDVVIPPGPGRGSRRPPGALRHG